MKYLMVMYLLIEVYVLINIFGFITAMKIQISQETRTLLDNIGGFVTMDRGLVMIKVTVINCNHPLHYIVLYHT